MAAAGALLDLAKLGVLEGPIGSNRVIGTAPCLARFAVSALAVHASLPREQLELDPGLRVEARHAAEDLERYLAALVASG